MHVDIARSFFTAAGRPRSRPAEPWPAGGMTVPEPGIQAASPAIFFFTRLLNRVRRWIG